jgi:TPR repeat protein
MLGGRMNTGTAPVAVGDVIGGRYRIEALLGQGGMAIVYQARHTATGRPCALKLVHQHLVTRKELVELFVREAQVGARIGQNPHIVDVFDAGADEARRVPFLALELLQGETLEDYIDNRGPMPPALVRIVVEHLADALDQAHRAGVIHRDLKPSNLFLISDRKGQPILKVMDFGIAKILEAEVQRTATQVGTPAYAAPEQMGASIRRLVEKQGSIISAGVSPATDVWAMGLVVFELFTGLPTGHYWGVETLTELPFKVALEEPEPASIRAADRSQLLPPGFDGWLARCLRRNAADRWPSAGQAAAELFRLMQQGAPVSAVTAFGAPLEWNGGAQTPTPYAASYPPAQTPQGAPYHATPPGYTPVGYAPQHTPARPLGPTALVPVPVTAGSPARKSTLVVLVAVAGFFAVMAVASGFGYKFYHESATQRACEDTGQRCEEACAAGHGPSCTRLGMTLEQVKGGPSDEVKAAALFKKACDGGDMRGCVQLGVFHDRGMGGIPRDAGHAVRLFKQACDGRALVGCAHLGRMHEKGEGGLSRDEARAVELYQQACTGGELRGCRGLGTMFAAGQGGLAKDDTKAAALFKQACDGGESIGCNDLALLVSAGRGGLTKDDAKASELYRKACDGGALGACSDLGVRFEAGRGVPRDEVRAVALYKQACDGGALLGCDNLARMYESGSGGLPKNEVRAAELFKQACDGGDLTGCNNYGVMSEDGRGVPQDEARAAALFKQACDGGDTSGCRNLGDLYRSGRGVPRDEAHALTLTRSACDKGDMYACSVVGWFYENGKGGLGRDEHRALELYKQACDAGDGLGCTNYGIYAEVGRGGLTRDERAAATAYAKGCEVGRADACSSLGWFVFQGRGGQPKDRDRGIDLLRKGCRAGNDFGCERLRATGARLD